MNENRSGRKCGRSCLVYMDARELPEVFPAYQTIRKNFSRNRAEMT